jgi:hypothetical protein
MSAYFVFMYVLFCSILIGGGFVLGMAYGMSIKSP